MALLALFAVAQPVSANQYIGDLVYCDVAGEKGVYEPDLGDYGLDGVEVNIVCREQSTGDVCGNFTTTTGALDPTILSPNKFFLGQTGGCADVIDYGPDNLTGRYAVNIFDPGDLVPNAECTGFSVCETTVNQATVPPECDMLITPLVAPPTDVPADGNGDGDFCDPVDGPFPEGQILGDNSESQALCETYPSAGPPMSGTHSSVHGSSNTRCALYNDFGFMERPPDEECDVAVDKTCCIPPPPPSPGEFKCKDAKPITTLSLIWDGASGVDVETESGQTFNNVQNGDLVVLDVEGLGNDIDLDFSGADSGSSRFHVSCSDDEMNGPEDCGTLQGNGKDNDSGDNLWIFEGMAGDQVLECNPAPAGGADETTCVVPGGSTGDDCQGKVLEAIFEYTGADCAVPLANPQEDKAECSGSTGLVTASIEFTKDEDEFRINGELGGTTGVAIGDLVSITDKDAGGELKSEVKVDVIGSSTQSLKIHTSCSKDLNVGDVFGSLTLVELTTTEGGTVVANPGDVEFMQSCELEGAGDVEFQFKVTNSGMTSIDVTSVYDNWLDEELLGGPVMLDPGEMVTLFEVAEVSEDITNKVTVTANDGAAQCMAMDELDVTVVPPPPEDFKCKDAKPITTLTLIWDGASGVDVETESGQTFTNVQNGDEITLDVEGLGNDVDLDFSGADSGSSRFHVSCSDDEMNGPEDCGTLQGNGKDNSSGDNLWIFEGMAGSQALDCSP